MKFSTSFTMAIYSLSAILVAGCSQSSIQSFQSKKWECSNNMTVEFDRSNIKLISHASAPPDNVASASFTIENDTKTPQFEGESKLSFENNAIATRIFGGDNRLPVLYIKDDGNKQILIRNVSTDGIMCSQAN